MAIRNIGRPVKPGGSSDPSERGRVYAGGSKWFDETTGRYRPGTPQDILDRVYGRGRKGDRPDRGINPPRPPRGRKPKPGDGFIPTPRVPSPKQGSVDGSRTIMQVPPKGRKRRPMIDPEDRVKKLPTRKNTHRGWR